jgi:hypothetical protein
MEQLLLGTCVDEGGVHDKDIRERFEVSSKVTKVHSFLLESNGHKGEGKGAKIQYLLW